VSDLFEQFTWACFQPHLRVSGLHSQEALPIAAALRAGFEARHPEVLEQVLALPQGFDGRRAALKSWAHRPGELHLHTGERTYSESLTLAQLIREQDLPPPATQPDPAWSWGLALASLVLLPQRRVLVGRRAEHLRAAPGRWAAVFTEVLEPADIAPAGMEPALARLAAEELAPLQHLGSHHFVGLIHLTLSRQWIVVAALDLREVPGARLEPALAALAPDHETVDWATQPLDAGAAPAHAGVIGMRLARDVHARLCTP
jgi:hypothetical protein